MQHMHKCSYPVRAYDLVEIIGTQAQRRLDLLSATRPHQPVNGVVEDLKPINREEIWHVK